MELLFSGEVYDYSVWLWLPTLVYPPFLLQTFHISPPPIEIHISRQALHTLEECPLGICLVPQHCSALSSHHRRNFQNWQLFHKIKRGGETNFILGLISQLLLRNCVPSEEKKEKKEALREHCVLGEINFDLFVFFLREIFPLGPSSRGPSLQQVPCCSSNLIVFFWVFNGQYFVGSDPPEGSQ